jgi:hypothetical protein
MRDEPVTGDLYDPSASSVDVLAAMKVLVAREHPRTTTVLSNRISVGAWRVTAAILRDERDLADPIVAKEVKDGIAATMARFGYAADDPARDHRERLFDVTVAIHEDYWSHRQLRNLEGFSITPFARLIRRVESGMRIENVGTGASYVVSSSGMRGITAQAGGERLTIAVPRRDALATRDELFRIARGSERYPDAHDLYRIRP